ncbi:MAG: DUF2258 domain-containing protein [Candidatus Aenigmatarchaeota archaeon]
MPTLRTGYVKTTGFGIKIRKALFAAKKVNFPNIPNEKVAQLVGELNQKIFERLQKLSVGRDDVLKIQFDYKIENDNIKVDYDTLQIKVFKPMEESLRKIFDNPEEKKIIERVIGELKKYNEEMIKISNDMLQLITEIERVYQAQITNQK